MWRVRALVTLLRDNLNIKGLTSAEIQGGTDHVQEVMEKEEMTTEAIALIIDMIGATVMRETIEMTEEIIREMIEGLIEEKAGDTDLTVT